MNGMQTTTQTDYTLTGIPGFDDLIGKGIPRGHVISIFGGPGAGKTTFALQYLVNGARNYDEPGLYVSLDENINDIKKNMSAYGWNLDLLEKKKQLLLLDASFFKRMSDILANGNMEKHEMIGELGKLVKESIAEMDAKRVVIDPMSTMVFQYPDPNERRLAIVDLLCALRLKKDCTSFMVMDLRSSMFERDYQIEEFLTQGTILLQTISQAEMGLTRVCCIEKMRGVEHDTQLHLYAITDEAIRVFPGEKVYINNNSNRC